jgi:hypothetical protein
MTAYIILLPEGAAKADAGLPPTIVVPTIPVAIIRSVVMSVVAIAIIRSIVMSVVIGSIAVPVPPIIDFLHLASTGPGHP